jgi:hypothetical protein
MVNIGKPKKIYIYSKYSKNLLERLMYICFQHIVYSAQNCNTFQKF